MYSLNERTSIYLSVSVIKKL